VSNIAVHYYQDVAAANNTLAEIRKRGSDGFIVQADVCKMDQITRMFSWITGQIIYVDGGASLMSRRFRRRSNSGSDAAPT